MLNHAPMTDVLFRPATAADSSRIADILFVSRRTFLPWLPSTRTDDEMRRWISGVLVPGGGVTVAEEEGELIGMMALSRNDEISWVDQLYLTPHAVNRGIGTRLLKLGLEHLEPPVRLFTFQQNSRARRFYERHGFRPIAFTNGAANEEHFPDVLYELR